ncbi:hypothetical protein ACLOJK_029206 [Asimina triloba]
MSSPPEIGSVHGRLTQAWQNQHRQLSSILNVNELRFRSNSKSRPFAASHDLSVSMAAPKAAAHQSRSDDIRRLTLHLLHFRLATGQRPIRQITTSNRQQTDSKSGQNPFRQQTIFVAPKSERPWQNPFRSSPSSAADSRAQ